MSRYYEMRVTIARVTTNDIDELQYVINEEWSFEALEEESHCRVPSDAMDTEYEPGLTAIGQGSLSGAEGEEEFTQRLSRAIWGYTKRYVPVEVQATYLDDLPFETVLCDEDAYKEWQEEANNEQHEQTTVPE